MKLARALLVCAIALAALPFVGALPGDCADPCEIAADGTFGYGPAVASIASGTTVVWWSPDYTHLTKDGRGFFDGDACFAVWGSPGEPAPGVRFDVVDGALVATVDGVSTTCGTAVATPQGATLPYFCVLHPTMRGSLVVTA